MSRRSLTLLVAGLLVLVLGVVGAVMPVPYVILSPGPTANTLGQQDGKPLIQINGHRTYSTTGHLNLTTVTYQGGPDARLDLFTALRAWFDPHAAVVPQEALFPPDESQKQVDQENAAQMTGSQEAATAAALTELKIPYSTVVVVSGTTKGMPANGKLRSGDFIQAVDGTKVTDPDKAAALISGRAPGKPVKITYQRSGKSADVTLTTAKGEQNKAMIGIAVGKKFQFPFKVQVSVGDIGGPSAGTMFALGMIDKLTPGELTGGKFIAGTGEISPDGEVSPIGGIQQKLVGARDAGATIFLTPKDNCKDAMAARPDGLRLVKIDTLHDAVQALAALRTGKGNVPACG
ncbi:MAG TPA: PDZ domain-containing protein [Streptosporangiaceae bacterium]|jgi:PDZ domain-containing protein